MLDVTRKGFTSVLCIYMYTGVYWCITAMEWILQPEPYEPSPPVPVIEDLLTSAEFIQSDTPMVWLSRALILSEEIIIVTALATKGQRKNPLSLSLEKTE